MTHSSAAIATSCRCAQATSRHHSRSYEQTYSHQFGHRQMIDLIRNVGEFEGTAIANELTHACAPARAHLTTSDQFTNHVAVFVVWDSVPRHTSRQQRLSTSNLHSVQWVINNCHRFPKPLWQFFTCLRRQKSDLTPSPPRPRIRGGSPKYLPLFRQKEFCNEH